MTQPAATYDSTSVESLIPHRAPFVLVDTIRILDPGVRCSSSWQVRASEPVLSGHFPGNPILPGVFLVEHTAQTACALMGAVGAPNGRLPVLVKIEDCRFHGAVRPGNLVQTEVALERTLGAFSVFTAEAKVGRRRVLRCRLVVSLAAAADLA